MLNQIGSYFKKKFTSQTKFLIIVSDSPNSNLKCSLLATDEHYILKPYIQANVSKNLSNHSLIYNMHLSTRKYTKTS